MNKTFSSILTALATPPTPSRPYYRYGMLAVIAALLGFNALWFLRLSSEYPYDPYSNLVVVLMLLLNHLSGNFSFPQRTTIILRVVSWLWLAFGLFYILCLSRILYPL